MLWQCERKSRIWWTDDLSLVRICVELLHELAHWLNEARCPHYFVNNCNLVDESDNLEIIESRLISTSKSQLSSWFVNNYIRKCSQLCPLSVSRLFLDASTTMKLQNAVTAILDCRQNSTMIEMWEAHQYAANNITFTVSNFTLTVWSLHCWLDKLRNIAADLPVFFSSVAFLHVACETTRNGLNDELMDVLAVLIGQSTGLQRYPIGRNSVLFLSKAASVMKVVDDRHKSRRTVQMVAIELCKAYLHRALKCEDSESDSIYCLANVYLAVLYYTTGQYQTAIDHSTLVMRS